MTNDLRCSFEEAAAGFVAFLASQGWSTDVRWLTRDRVTGHRTHLWVFRPEDLVSSARTREHYESARKGDLNLRFEGLGQLDGRTLAFVELGPGNSRFLNYAVCTSPYQRIRAVRSTLAWWSHRTLNAIRGETPFLRLVDMPNVAEPSVAADAPQAARR